MSGSQAPTAAEMEKKAEQEKFWDALSRASTLPEYGYTSHSPPHFDAVANEGGDSVTHMPTTRTAEDLEDTAHARDWDVGSAI